MVLEGWIYDYTPGSEMAAGGKVGRGGILLNSSIESN